MAINKLGLIGVFQFWVMFVTTQKLQQLQAWLLFSKEKSIAVCSLLIQPELGHERQISMFGLDAPTQLRKSLFSLISAVMCDFFPLLSLSRNLLFAPL